MKTMTILGVTVKTHNKREERLVNIINRDIETVEEYDRENTFKERTERIIRNCVDDINGLLTALYFMHCMENIVISYNYVDS